MSSGPTISAVERYARGQRSLPIRCHEDTYDRFIKLALRFGVSRGELLKAMLEELDLGALRKALAENKR